MKRFLKFFVAIVASAMTLFSCEDKELEQILAQIAFDKASYEIGAEGGQLTVKVLTTVDWTAALSAATSLDNIEGITLAADKGKGSSEPIEIVVNFAVNEGFDRTVKLSLSGGGVSGSCTITQKGSAVREMEKVTVAQFLEKAEDASIYYELKGIVKSITNTDYSNFMMKDIDGDAEILIYGLAYESDVANQKVQLLVKEGIQEGDIITIASTRGSYNGTPEGMNSYYISHEKSATPMLKIDKETYEASASGEVFDLTVTSNIVTWTLSADVDWLSFEPATGNASTTVKVTVAAGEGGTGTITASADGLDPVTCVVTRADLTVLTIAEFLTKPDDPNKAYQIGGIITDIVMDKDDATKPNKYGNFYIKDRTGEAYIYGLLPEKGGASGQNVIAEKGLKIGDFVSLAAPKSSYNDAPQGKNAWLLAAYPAKTLTEFLALEDDATKSVFYTVSGTVTSIVMDKTDETKPNKYGNIYIKDADGVELYIYGTLDWEGAKANFESLELKVGDVITGYAYKSSYNGAGQAVNLQPVLIESGEPVVEDKWDYTPSAEYVAATNNLWKPIFDGNFDYVFGQVTGYQVEEITESKTVAKKESTYKFSFTDATEGEWGCCNFLAPLADHPVALKAGTKYNLSVTLGATAAISKCIFSLHTYKADADNREGDWLTDLWGEIPANTPTTFTQEFTPSADIANIAWTIIPQFGTPAGMKFYIKDICIVPIVKPEDPVYKFEWRTEADTLVNVPFNQAGAAHWYVEKDAEVEYEFKVYTDDGSVYTENGPGITIEPAANHVAINYAANELAIPRKWMVTATTTANVKNPVLTAILIQGAYEYTDLKELNKAIIASGNTEVTRIINITKPIELTKVEGSNVFAQGKGENFTGGILLYGTGLEKDTSHGIGWSVTGRVVAVTKAFNGVPEVTKIVSGAETLTWTKTEGYPCQTKTIAELKADYDKFVNVKCNVVCRVIDAFSSSDRNGKVADTSGDIAVYVQLKEGVTGQVEGANLSQFIVWPSYYRETQQLGVWADKGTTVASIETSIKMPETLSLAVDATSDLKATTNSTATITYSSSDTNVATVSAEGIVTAKAVGTATITASVEKSGLYKAATATCAVTVTEGEGGEGGGGGEEVDPYSIDLTYRLGTNAYDDNVATVNEKADVKVIKIGTSSKKGEFTVVIPAGTKKITYYAVGWTGKNTTLDFQINGASAAQQALVANAGATGNSPFTLTVTDADKYEIVNDFAVETPVVVTTTTNARAILFGLKAE